MIRKILYPFVLLIFTVSQLTAQNWLTNLNEAKQKAQDDHKNILLVFFGSDWCAPCMKLERTIWQSEEFKTFAKEHFILLKADFPKQKKNQLEPLLQEQNNQLAAKYNKNGFFPLVVILDKDGKLLGSTGYKNVTPKDYIDILASLEK